jgi:hypothetical protein
MALTFACLACGNTRSMSAFCQHCGSADLPLALQDTFVLNLKRDGPSADEALERLTQALRRANEVGIKVMIVIHGYGSSGEGGRIKRALQDALNGNYFADRVDEYFFGEHIPYGSPQYQALLKRRPSLKRHLKYFKEGNAGMTVLLLCHSSRYA